jgi:hypothetical protein
MKPLLTIGDHESQQIVAGLWKTTADATCTLDECDVVAALKFIGCTNKSLVHFANHIALPETLVLCKLKHANGEIVGNFITRRSEIPDMQIDAGDLGKMLTGPLTLCFKLSMTRGLCEDGRMRRTGWNRFWRPEPPISGWRKLFEPPHRWERVVDSAGKLPYPHAEDIGGFEKLWEAAK